VVCEPIAQHDLGLVERRKNNAGQMLPTRSKNQQRFRLRIHRLLRTQQQRA
jgi:hypothetical protein